MMTTDAQIGPQNQHFQISFISWCMSMITRKQLGSSHSFAEPCEVHLAKPDQLSMA